MSPRAGLDQAALLKAAAELANKDGLEAVTLARMAQKLGVKPPSLYNHVNGLPGLQRLLGIYALERLHDTLLKSMNGNAGDDAMMVLGIAYVDFVRSHPGLYEAAQLRPDITDTELNNAQSRIVELAVKSLEAYRLTPDAAIHAVRGFRSLCHGFATLEQQGGFGLPLDLDVSLRMLIGAFIDGIRRFPSMRGE